MEFQLNVNLVHSVQSFISQSNYVTVFHFVLVVVIASFFGTTVILSLEENKSVNGTSSLDEQFTLRVNAELIILFKYQKTKWLSDFKVIVG